MNECNRLGWAMEDEDPAALQAVTEIGPDNEQWLDVLVPYRRPALPAPPAQPLYPTPALAADGDTLSASQVRSWREEGCTLVAGLWPEELIRTLRADMHRERVSSPGIGAGVQFPSFTESLNAVVLHPRIHRAAAQLLGSADLRVSQAESWSKTGANRSEDGISGIQ